MDELESRLERELSGLGRVPLAEPEPVENLRRRARRVRVSRAVTGVAAVATAVVVVAAVVVSVNNNSPEVKPHQTLRVFAPGFVLGDIDAVVLSSGFDADGARESLPPALAATVAKVPGVQSVSGVIDTFAPVTDEPLSPDQGPPAQNTVPPRSPILFSYHRDDEVHITAGRSPASTNEIVVDADFLSREHTQVGDKVALMVKGAGQDFTIVGTFDLPGANLTGIPLAAMSAAQQPPDIQLDRIDVKLAPGVDAANVRDAIAGAVGSDYTVVPPSAISFPDQRLAQLEIQHAYWALLSPDQSERSTSGVGPPSAQESENYAKYSTLAKEVELRVENVTFLSPDAATLTYRIYYSGEPSSIIDQAQTGSATRVNGHWQLGTNTLCSLAALVGISCKGTDNVTITPPNGYQPVTTLDPGILHAFTVLADPHSTVDQRIGVVADGARLRSVVQAGVTDDQAVTQSQLSVAGWRLVNPTQVQILYSLTTTGGPSTPWPSTATATEAADGHWYATSGYACGISALAGSGCFTGTPPPGSAAGVLGVSGTPSHGTPSDGTPPDGTTVTTAIAVPARP